MDTDVTAAIHEPGNAAAASPLKINSKYQCVKRLVPGSIILLSAKLHPPVNRFWKPQKRQSACTFV